MNVKYSGYWGASSGMGEACRNFIKSLHDGGANVTTELIPNIKSKNHLGDNYDLAMELNNRQIDYKVKIIHITPDSLITHLEPTKYHIFHLFWETDRLPKEWVWALNLCDEVWTGSEWNKEVFKNSGVTKPIYVFPQPTDTKVTGKPFEVFYGPKQEPVKHQGFLFYSIFQWIERKDPKTLLEAYWREFRNEKNVGLLLKTYREKFTHDESLEIVKEITKWKSDLGLNDLPNVYIYVSSLDRGDINRLHNTGDCFVTSTRGEGWGIPIAEAMLAGKPVIATKLGGVQEHIPDKHYVPVEYDMTNVFNMDFVPWYTTEQMWGQVSIADLRKRMRAIYNNQDTAKKIGKRGQKWAKGYFDYERIGKLMIERLKEI